MQSRDTSIRDNLNKYLQEERKIEQKLHECDTSRNEIKSKRNSSTDQHFDSVQTHARVEQETAQIRNQRFLKDLEKAKARLRTFATFTPTDQELHDLATFYRQFLVTPQETHTPQFYTKNFHE